MAKEIEKKFLVDRGAASNFIYNSNSSRQKYKIEQFYLKKGKEEERVRRKENFDTNEVSYTHTVKKGSGLVREEIEREISKEEFDSMKKKSIASIEKIRMVVGDLEFDFYKNGLTILEIEFQSEEDAEKAPPENLLGIILEDVTNDARYKNQNLAS